MEKEERDRRSRLSSLQHSQWFFFFLMDMSVLGTDISSALFPYQALCACAMR